MTHYLYVEDELFSRQAMKMIIERSLGQPLTVFEDSSDFTAKLLALDPKPHIILLDIHMEPYSGFEVLKMVRALPDFDSTPVVALTASVMNEEIRQLRNAGFSGVIAKPFSLTTLPHLLNRIQCGEQVWTIIEK